MNVYSPSQQLQAGKAGWHGGESPKAFFAFLSAHPAHFHRVFAKWLTHAGFEIRWIRKRATHGVWNLYLLRGAVPPGEEDETARNVISATLKLWGVACAKSEVEVSIIGTRIGAAFIFESGTPGSLVYSRGRESWCPDTWP